MEDFQTVLLTAGQKDLIANKSDLSHKSFVRTPSGELLIEAAFECYRSKSNNIIIVDNDQVENFCESNFRNQSIDVKLLRVSKTRGALASLLLSVDLLVPELPILVAPLDGLLPKSLVRDFISQMRRTECTSGTVVFNSVNPDYSYVRTSKNSRILEFAEKRVIGNWATTGLFYYRNLGDLILAAEWTFKNNLQIDDVFYISNSLNYFVLKDFKIDVMVIDEKNYTRYPSQTDLSEN
jgi:hypothetical protein